MSCPRCEDAQEVVVRQYYLRVGDGNVEVRACEAHFQVLQIAWRDFLKNLAAQANLQNLRLPEDLRADIIRKGPEA